MKEFKTKNIRNVTFAGHGGSGKTSLSEAILFTAGETTRLGKIEEGNTISDFKNDEIERRISISASVLHCEWQGNKINFIDTPGYADFVGEVKCSLSVSDAAGIFVKAVEGIEVGCENSWKFAEELKLPVFFIINKCDNERSDFNAIVTQIKNQLSRNAVVLQFPVNQGLNFDSVIDLIKMKMLVYQRNGNGKYKTEDIPANLTEEANKLREELIEKVAETEEELMNKFFESGTLTEEEIATGLKKGFIKREIHPILPAAGTSNVNSAGILDFMSTYVPNPLEAPRVKGYQNGKEIEVEVKEEGEPCLFVFKTTAESAVGELSFFKVYSGVIEPGLDMHNIGKNKSERLSQISISNGKTRKEVSKLYAGDIGAVVKLKDTNTNDTLVSKSLGIKIKEIEFPKPIIEFAVKPKSKGDEDKIANGFHSLQDEDPTFLMKFDPELSQTVISGQGELHLTLAAKKLKDKFGVEVELIEPKIPFRETIKTTCHDAEYKHKKQSGGRGQYGHVHLKVEPLKRGEGFSFQTAIVGGAVPSRFFPGVEKGVVETMEKGVIAGYKVVDVRVTLFDGTFHDVDSDEMSFKIAGSQAFKKGFQEAKPVLLEPIYEIKVKVPEEFMGDVMGDISSRRGKILGMESEGNYQIVRAEVPLSELYKYATQLRSLTQGRGSHEKNFIRYEEVPKDKEVKIIEAAQKEKEES